MSCRVPVSQEMKIIERCSNSGRSCSGDFGLKMSRVAAIAPPRVSLKTGPGRQRQKREVDSKGKGKARHPSPREKWKEKRNFHEANRHVLHRNDREPQQTNQICIENLTRLDFVVEHFFALTKGSSMQQRITVPLPLIITRDHSPMVEQFLRAGVAAQQSDHDGISAFLSPPSPAAELQASTVTCQLQYTRHDHE